MEENDLCLWFWLLEIKHRFHDLLGPNPPCLDIIFWESINMINNTWWNAVKIRDWKLKSFKKGAQIWIYGSEYVWYGRIENIRDWKLKNFKKGERDPRAAECGEPWHWTWWSWGDVLNNCYYLSNNCQIKLM